MTGPITFQREVLKRELWAKQREIVTAISTKRSVSVKGCHGSGKSFAVAGYVPYEMVTQTNALVLTVAPTLRQVKLLWHEIEAAIATIEKESGVRFPERTTTSWQLTENLYAQGMSSSKGVNVQGFHARRVLIIADEAIGISPDLWDAIEGIRSSGDVRLVKLCNPTVPEGAPFEDFTRLRASTECITISAFDTPNLEGLTIESLLALPEDQLDYAPFPWLTRRRWVKEMYYKWGPTNPRFLSRVLGEFPTQATDSVFQLSWIEAAGAPIDQEKFAADLHAMKLAGRRPFIQVGLDIAGPGDDETSVYARMGPYVLDSQAWSKPDPLDDVLLFLARVRARFPGVPMAVMADVVGIGYHFARAVARRVGEVPGGFEVFEFRAGNAPVDQVTFANAKAEAYWRTREHMRLGEITGIEDEDTKAQLSDVRYRELPNSKIEIEHKDEARARGSSSPDRAEALIMAFAAIVPRVQDVYRAGYQDAGGY